MWQQQHSSNNNNHAILFFFFLSHGSICLIFAISYRKHRVCLFVRVRLSMPARKQSLLRTSRMNMSARSLRVFKHCNNNHSLNTPTYTQTDTLPSSHQLSNPKFQWYQLYSFTDWWRPSTYTSLVSSLTKVKYYCALVSYTVISLFK